MREDVSLTARSPTSLCLLKVPKSDVCIRCLSVNQVTNPNCAVQLKDNLTHMDKVQATYWPKAKSTQLHQPVLACVDRKIYQHYSLKGKNVG